MKKVVKEYIDKKKTQTSRKLEKQTDASNLISKYLKQYETDKIEPTKFRNLCYGTKIFSDILRNEWIDQAQKRLEELEKQVLNGENQGLTFEGWDDEKLDNYIEKETKKLTQPTAIGNN